MLLTLLGINTISFKSFAQTSSGVEIKGSCGDSVVVISSLTFDLNLYFHNQVAQQENNPCYHTLFAGGPMDIQYRLQKLNPSSGNWEWASNYQYSIKFTGLGTSLTQYRVIAFKPVIIPNNQCDGGYEKVYNYSGQHVGFRGLYEQYTSNIAIVGKPNGYNNSYKFVDGNGILLFGSDPSLPMFDPGENWQIDVSESTNYNAWYLAMYKDDDPTNLPWAEFEGGWHSNGPPANPVIDIAHWWKNSGGYEFDPLSSYIVQWVAQNKDCTDWNVNEKSAYICPVGFGCKIGLATDEGAEQIALYPNPVRDQFYLTESPIVSWIELNDGFGRKLGSWAANQERYDVSHLVSGTYYVQFFDTNHRLMNVASIQVMR